MYIYDSELLNKVKNESKNKLWLTNLVFAP